MAAIDPRESPLYPLIKAKRAKMSNAKRNAIRNKPRKGKWLYPWASERKYAAEITRLMREITRPATQWIEENYNGMVRGFRTDKAQQPSCFNGQRWDEACVKALGEDNPNFEAFQPSLRVDALSDDLNQLNDLLREIDSRLFVDQEPERLEFLKRTAEDVQDYNSGQFGKFINQYAEGVFFPREVWLDEVVTAWATTNYTLIRSLSQEYIRRVNGIVSEAVQDGRTWNVVRDDIQGLNSNITRSRANLIARDQIGKLNGRITERRQNEAGIDQYDWSTSRDERVRGNPLGRYPKARPSHYVMEGKRCRWDDSTVYSKDKGKTWVDRTGKMPKVHPGIAIQCRCDGLPVFDELMRAVDTDLAIDEGDIQQFEKVQEVSLPPMTEPEKKLSPSEYLRQQFAKMDAIKRKQAAAGASRVVKKPAKVTPKLEGPTSDQIEAIKTYTGNAYESVNPYLRYGDKGLKMAAQRKMTKAQVEELVEKIDNGLAASKKYKGTTYRVLQYSSEVERDELFNKFKVGDIYKDKGAFVSTTKEKGVIDATLDSLFDDLGENSGMYLKIKGRSGVDLENISINPGEAEVLFPRDVKFKVVRTVYEKGGKNVFLELEEI